MIISLIAAMSENRVIGRDNALPWHMPADLKYFKETTTGHVVITGRKSFESAGQPLPNRTNIVITRNHNYKAEGATVVHSLDDALNLARNEKEVFILGGEEIFRIALPRANCIYLTVIHATIEGDTHFPEFDEREWKLVHDERHGADVANKYPYSFRRYERVS